jgi:hypothetical protein
MSRRNKLKSATAEELVEYFIAVVQEKAMRQGGHAKYNRLYGEMDAVEREEAASWRSKTCTHSTA